MPIMNCYQDRIAAAMQVFQSLQQLEKLQLLKCSVLTFLMLMRYCVYSIIAGASGKSRKTSQEEFLSFSSITSFSLNFLQEQICTRGFFYYLPSLNFYFKAFIGANLQNGFHAPSMSSVGSSSSLSGARSAPVSNIRVITTNNKCHLVLFVLNGRSFIFFHR